MEGNKSKQKSSSTITKSRTLLAVPRLKLPSQHHPSDMHGFAEIEKLPDVDLLG